MTESGHCSPLQAIDGSQVAASWMQPAASAAIPRAPQPLLKQYSHGGWQHRLNLCTIIKILATFALRPPPAARAPLHPPLRAYPGVRRRTVIWPQPQSSGARFWLLASCLEEVRLEKQHLQGGQANRCHQYGMHLLSRSLCRNDLVCSRCAGFHCQQAVVKGLY